jgi:hypothetical protein
MVDAPGVAQGFVVTEAAALETMLAKSNAYWGKRLTNAYKPSSPTAKKDPD